MAGELQSPVCGNDGITYKSLCNFLREMCVEVIADHFKKQKNKDAGKSEDIKDDHRLAKVEGLGECDLCQYPLDRGGPGCQSSSKVIEDRANGMIYGSICSMKGYPK